MFAHRLVPHPSSQRALAHMAKTLPFHCNLIYICDKTDGRNGRKGIEII
jgi:hypothetical protein